MSKNNEKYSNEELAIGIVYREFRIAKGFTQEEAAGDEISATHLSNFENGKTIVSTHHFFCILQNINVNMFEFQNALNQYLEEKDLLLFSMEMTNALVEQNSSKLRLIVGKLEDKIDVDVFKPNFKKNRLDYIRAKSTLSFLDTACTLTEDEILFLEKYLFKLKEWGQYDIALLGQCAQFLDWIHLIELTERMISPSQTSNNLPYIKQAIIQNVLNIINVFIEAGLYAPAKKFIKYLENTDIHDYFMFEKLTLIYNTARYSHKKGDSSALDMMKSCQQILEFCKCFKTSNWIATEISDIDQ